MRDSWHLLLIGGFLVPVPLWASAASLEKAVAKSTNGYEVESVVTITGVGQGAQSGGAYQVVSELDTDGPNATERAWELYE